ncbi:MAG: class I SAM-dependent methyltransferase [Pseudonocardia sp.]
MTATTIGPLPARDPYTHIAEADEATAARLAERFEIRASDPRQHRLWRDVLARVPAVEGARVLEVGCGTGIIAAKLAELPGVAEVTGVDPSPYFVERARRRAPALQLHVADGRALPFDDGTFHGVVFATTLCHVPGAAQALTEAHRVLRPGGYLLVYDGDYATATVALGPHDPLQACVQAAVTALVHDPWLVRRLRPLVRDAGFEPADLHSHGYLELDSPAYVPSLVDVGADMLAAAEAVSADTAATLKAEARARADRGCFFGHIAYASLLATRIP